MKRFVFAALFLAVVMFCAAAPITAQQNQNGDDGTVVMKKSDLTQDQLAKVQQQKTDADIDQRIQRYGKWVGLGKEVGVAVDSSLGAITDQADHFSKTGVGKLTIALVIWKVLGDQAVHIVAAGVELMLIIPLWIWSYRKFCFSHRILVEKGPGFFGQKKWQVIAPLSDRGYNEKELQATSEFMVWMHWGALLFFGIVWLFTVFTY